MSMMIMPSRSSHLFRLTTAGLSLCLLSAGEFAVALDQSVKRTVKTGELVSLGKHLVREKNCDTSFPDITLVVPPRHGTVCVEIATSTNWVAIKDPPPNPQCKGRRSRGLQVTYAPAPGYAGKDRIQYDVTWPKGDLRRDVTVTVKPVATSPLDNGAQALKQPQEPGSIPNCDQLTS